MTLLKRVFHLIPTRLRKKKVLFIVLGVLFAVWFVTKGAPNYALVKTEAVKRGDIKTEVVASGVVSSEDNSSLHFAVSGKVAWVNVAEGQHVTRGDVIATLDRERYEIALRQAQSAFTAAKAAVEKIYDTTKRKTDESFTEKVERTAAEAKQDNAYDGIKEAERDLRDTVLYAPFDGTIVDLDLYVGQEVRVTDDVAKIVNLSNLEFTAEVDEVDIGKILVKKSALITLDAYPKEQLKAEVVRIGQDTVTTATGATSFPVIFSMPPSEKIRVGMNGEVKVVIAEKKDALAVPLEALVEEDVVWVKNGTGYKKQKITQGISSDTQAEVIKGLTVDDSIVVSGYDELEKKSILMRILGK